MRSADNCNREESEMDTSLLFSLIAIVLLVMGNAFFVGAEIALTSARRSRIKQLADTGNKSAHTVQLLHSEPERFYSVTQIGITLVSLALGAIGITTMEQIFDPAFEAMARSLGEGKALVGVAHTAAYALGFIVISFFHVVGGELAPKILAFHRAEPLSLAVAWIINFLYRSLSPLIWVMNKAAEGLLWLLGQRDLAKDGSGHFSISEEEIRTILNASEREGVLNADETQMIRGVFDLDERKVRDAMIPRTDVLAIDQDATVADALDLFKEARHARYPVYKDNLDNMVGMIAIKELLRTLADAEDADAVRKMHVSDIMLPLHIVPETKTLSDLLKDFKRTGQQMAVVLDEYGGTAGMITLEDILEEIVGEYADEFTKHEHRYVKKLSGSQYLIDAGIRVSDLEPLVNFPFPEGDYVTLGGLIYQQLGHIPAVGDEVPLDGGRLEVREMDNHRITKVLFQDLALAEDGSVRLAEEVSPEDVPAIEAGGKEETAVP
ncbi:MAG TPA: HlyC/CorC family transporter [Sedimenticola sp.]|nr:HlyC/CorC family transporter [Sedimenticola sp.]